MNLRPPYQLTYCTNIHPAESWEPVFESLQTYVLPLKQKLSPDHPFGVGLRLANLASRELLEGDRLKKFKRWLDNHGLYVAIINGFPYGSFHRERVKDHVYEPDWTNQERVNYTLRLCQILGELLPEGMDGGISTSPLSFKPWLAGDREKTTAAFEEATYHVARIAFELQKIRKDTGKVLHLDIEPEPACLLENTQETIDFYTIWLRTVGAAHLTDTFELTPEEADEALATHIQVCFDVCHFAVEHEDPVRALERLREAGIGIGRVQISAALKVQVPEDEPGRQVVKERLSPFVESTYLHQAIVKAADGTLTHYPDLPEALEDLAQMPPGELRTHFHVPVFLREYEGLQSTQDDIRQTLAYLKQQHLTRHLEVETYTWEVLPPDLKLELGASIQRELEWVVEQMNG
jgi:sugar phosphate isomerase/epimerase